MSNYQHFNPDFYEHIQGADRPTFKTPSEPQKREKKFQYVNFPVAGKRKSRFAQFWFTNELINR